MNGWAELEGGAATAGDVATIVGYGALLIFAFLALRFAYWGGVRRP